MQEFGLIRDKALGPTGSGTGITVEHFKSLWTQWLGPIFHTLERLLPLWVETKPPVIYITTQVPLSCLSTHLCVISVVLCLQARCDALLRAQGEFLIRLSESRPGWLALSYIPLIPGSISHRVENTRVEPTPDGCVLSNVWSTEILSLNDTPVRAGSS